MDNIYIIFYQVVSPISQCQATDPGRSTDSPAHRAAPGSSASPGRCRGSHRRRNGPRDPPRTSGSQRSDKKFRSLDIAMENHHFQ